MEEKRKSLGIKLANGKEEWFDSGSQLYDWWIKQSNARKTRKNNSKTVADEVISEIIGDKK